jgi:hypothetical protein
LKKQRNDSDLILLYGLLDGWGLMTQLNGGREETDEMHRKSVTKHHIISHQAVQYGANMMCFQSHISHFTLLSTRVWETFENDLHIKIAVLFIHQTLALESEKLCVGLSDYEYVRVCGWPSSCHLSVNWCNAQMKTLSILHNALPHSIQLNSVEHAVLSLFTVLYYSMHSLFSSFCFSFTFTFSLFSTFISSFFCHRHPEGKGIIYIGNQTAAEDYNYLK